MTRIDLEKWNWKLQLLETFSELFQSFIQNFFLDLSLQAYGWFLTPLTPLQGERSRINMKRSRCSAACRLIFANCQLRGCDPWISLCHADSDPAGRRTERRLFEELSNVAARRGSRKGSCTALKQRGLILLSPWLRWICVMKGVSISERTHDQLIRLWGTSARRSDSSDSSVKSTNLITISASALRAAFVSVRRGKPGWASPHMSSCLNADGGVLIKRKSSSKSLELPLVMNDHDTATVSCDSALMKTESLFLCAGDFSCLTYVSLSVTRGQKIFIGRDKRGKLNVYTVVQTTDV